MYTVESSYEKKLFPLYMEIFLGIIKEIIYFPVHKGTGFMIAGIGISPSQSSIHIIRFITYSLVKNKSLKVKSEIPSNESYTIPMTGLFDFGATIYLGT